ncbi:hypothetical protein [Chromobacterium amazonense]|nr:hypothetical protein [Chromobacterium amazonense]
MAKVLIFNSMKEDLNMIVDAITEILASALADVELSILNAPSVG